MASAQIQLLGTGTAFHTDGRASQAIWVEPGAGPPFLVDFGPSAMGQLERYEVDYTRAGALFVTHHHGDHFAGWPFLLLNLALLVRRTEPFRVHGPEGTRSCFEELARLCYGDLLAGSRLGFPVAYHEIAVQPAIGFCAGPGEGVRFDVVPMDHHPSSIGYRFHLDGVTLGVSGDTRWCAGLEELSRGSDWLVLECSSVAREGLPHLSLEELRRGIGKLHGARIVLVHLTDEVAAELALDPLPGVLAGHDGMTITLDPSDS